MLNIKEVLGDDFLNNFKVVYPCTLFEPVWENLKVNRCPLCGNKLKFPFNKKIVICTSVKHRKSFVIRKERFEFILNKS